MKRLLMLQILTIGLVCMFGISSASALGLGAYYNTGWGDGEIEYDDTDITVDIEPDHKTRAIGFVLDTNVAKDSVFNYRLNVSLDTIEFDSGFEADGYVMDHTFGFGVLRTQFVRLWIGPQINLAYYTDDYDHGYNYYDDDDFDMFGFGVGPAIGVNFNPGDYVSFTVTSGYKYMLLFGSTGDEDYTGYEGQYYINFGMMFRINDTY